MGFKLTPDTLPYSFSYKEAESALDTYLQAPDKNCSLLMVYAGEETPAFAAKKISDLENHGFTTQKISFEQHGMVRIGTGEPETFDADLAKKLWIEANQHEPDAKKILFLENIHLANPIGNNIISSLTHPSLSNKGYAGSVLTAPLGADIGITLGLSANRIKVEAPDLGLSSEMPTVAEFLRTAKFEPIGPTAPAMPAPILEKLLKFRADAAKAATPEAAHLVPTESAVREYVKHLPKSH